MEIKRNKLFSEKFNGIKTELIDHGYAELSDEWRAKNVCSPFSRIYYISEGEGFIKTKNNFMKLTAGNCYLIPAGLTYDFGCEVYMNQLFFHVIITESEGMNLLANANSFAKFTVGTDAVQNIINLYNDSKPWNALKIKAYLNNAVYHFVNQYNINDFSFKNYSSDVMYAVKYISRNPSIQIKVSDIAEERFISESKLIKKFKSEIGITIGKYIDNVVFERANFLLSKTDRPISSISNELGFCDQFYFARRFRQKFGETPLAYRKRVKLANKI